MAFVKSMSRISKKYADVTPARATEYAEGVANPRVPWDQATAAAEDAYKAGVTAAANQGRFGRGVKKAGMGKWQKGAREKGAVRFGAGVAMAEGDYAKGFEPYRQAIEATVLPPRYARRDPRNLERVRAIMAKLGSVKDAAGK